MSCCGKMRNLGWPSGRIVQVVEPASRTPQFVVLFEYVGRTALTAVGPISGRHYRFERPHARLPVDPRDRPGLARIPALHQVTEG